MLPLLLAPLLLLGTGSTARADVVAPPPTGKHYRSHVLRLDGLDAHPDVVILAFDGEPGGTISTHRVFQAGSAEQTLARGGSRSRGLSAPRLWLVPKAAYDTWSAETQATVSAQRTACSERGEGCVHISRFSPSYPSPAQAVACTDPIELVTEGLVTTSDTHEDVRTVAKATATACEITGGDGPKATASGDGGAGCTAAALSGGALLAGLGLLMAAGRRR